MGNQLHIGLGHDILHTGTGTLKRYILVNTVGNLGRTNLGLVDLASPQVSCWHKIRVLDGTRAVVNYGWVGCRDGCIPDICTVSVDVEFDRLL